jgi:hypothetical protein
MTILATATEFATLVLYILTAVQNQAVLSEREEALRRQELRKSVHRTMTGAGYVGNRSKARGWETGVGALEMPTINVIPA